MEITKKRKELLASLLSLKPRTIDEHIKNDRVYLDFFKYFSDEDIEDFLKNRNVPKLELIQNISYSQLFNLINNKHSIIKSEDEVLINALFKKHLLLSSLIEGLFNETIKYLNIKEINIKNVKQVFIENLNKVKLGIIYHSNHKKILKEQIDLFTSSELLSLIKYLVK